MFSLYFFFTITTVTQADRPKFIWCTISDDQQARCSDWAYSTRDFSKYDYQIECYKGGDKDACMNLIANERAHLVSLDPGEIYFGGRYHSLVPIMSERYGPSREPGYYSVAVVKKGSPIFTLNDLRGKKACFPGVGKMAGWVIPVSVLSRNNLLGVTDCNNVVKNVASFFNESCAPNALIDKHNPSGDNPLSMCSLCSNGCSGSGSYAGFAGAMRCLHSVGDVAFVKHTTLTKMNSNAALMYDLLCEDGRRVDLSAYRSCNWGYSPADAIVTLSSVPIKMKQFLQKVLQRNDQQLNSLLSLLSEDATALVPIDISQQTFSRYLGPADVGRFEQIQSCSISKATLCVISEKEYEKCIRMSRAFHAQGLKPDLNCETAHSKIDCMAMIVDGKADVTMLDPGDVAIAGLWYNLIPIVSETYNLNDSTFYAVAVARTADKDTDLLDLKGRRSCHTGYGEAAGWVMPLSFLLSNNRMRSYGSCQSARSASRFFSKSCVPGSLSNRFIYGESWDLSNLCNLCHGSSYKYCTRSDNEPFYGSTGALRCLIEGDGHVAFTRHTSILENAGRNPSFWSRNVIPDDFELLCRDGSRGKVRDYHSCNLGRVSANALVTHANRPREYINAYINLFILAQQFYGSQYSEPFTFKMFVSERDHADLIFSDATSQLIQVPPERRHYRPYLGHEFLKSVSIVDCRNGGNSLINYSNQVKVTILISTLISLSINLHLFTF